MNYTREIFVFGSNREGRHGKGAALVAKESHGAIQGYHSGLQGNSYAIITKELRRWMNPVTLLEVSMGIQKFLGFAAAHPDWKFNVTPIGCGLAGFKPEQIAPMFHQAPPNVFLPKEFL